MTDLERIKLGVRALISIGVAKTQGDIGKLMGYTNKSSFSKILNGQTPLPSDFMDRLCELSINLRKSFIYNGIGDVLQMVSDEKRKQVYNLIDKDKIDVKIDYKKLYEEKVEIIEILQRERLSNEKLIASLERENNFLINQIEEKSVSKTASNIAK